MHVDTLTDKVTARQADSQVKWPNRLKLNNNVKEQNKKTKKLHIVLHTIRIVNKL